MHSHSATRSNGYKLAVPRCRSEVRRRFWSVRGVQRWNALPAEVVQATSLESFKRRLDACVGDVFYKTVDNQWDGGERRDNHSMLVAGSGFTGEYSFWNWMPELYEPSFGGALIFSGHTYLRVVHDPLAKVTRWWVCWPWNFWSPFRGRVGACSRLELFWSPSVRCSVLSLLGIGMVDGAWPVGQGYPFLLVLGEYWAGILAVVWRIGWTGWWLWHWYGATSIDMCLALCGGQHGYLLEELWAWGTYCW